MSGAARASAGTAGIAAARSSSSAAEAVPETEQELTRQVTSARARARSRASALLRGWAVPGAFARAGGRGSLAPPAAVLGGALMSAGAFLPWLSFYAGLYPMRGITGPWGWVLAGGGALCALGGVVAWGGALRSARAKGAHRPNGANGANGLNGPNGANGASGRGRLWRVWARAIAVLAVALTAFAGWLLVQLLLAFRSLRANPMVVPRLGPGLFVACAGGLIMVAGLVAERRRAGAPTRVPAGEARRE